MIKTVKFATTATIHAAHADGTYCGSEVQRVAGSCMTKIAVFREVEGEITCKRCIKLVAKAQAAPVVVEAAPVEATEWTCPSCSATRRSQPTERELRVHASVCKGNVQERALRMVESYAELAESAVTSDQYAVYTRKQLEAEALATSALATYAQIVDARRAGQRAATAR